MKFIICLLDPISIPVQFSFLPQLLFKAQHTYLAQRFKAVLAQYNFTYTRRPFLISKKGIKTYNVSIIPI